MPEAIKKALPLSPIYEEFNISPLQTSSDSFLELLFEPHLTRV